MLITCLYPTLRCAYGYIVIATCALPTRSNALRLWLVTIGADVMTHPATNQTSTFEPGQPMLTVCNRLCWCSSAVMTTVCTRQFMLCQAFPQTLICRIRCLQGLSWADAIQDHSPHLTFDLKPALNPTPNITTPHTQINFAGEGGLYAEMLQDRSFDAMALALGFPPANATVPLRPSDTDEAAISRRHGRRGGEPETGRPSFRSGAIASLASLFSMPMPLTEASEGEQAGGGAAVTAFQIGSSGTWELHLPASAFGKESYGGKPRLPRPPTHRFGKAGVHVPGR